MKSGFIFYLLLCLSIILLPILSWSETTTGEPIQGGVTQEAAKPVELSKIEAKTFGVALGLRSTYFKMTQNTGQIIRNVNLLDEEQNYLPVKPVVQVNLSKYLALELGYDQFKASTLNRGFTVENVTYGEHDRRFSDGDIEWSPFMLALQFRWPHFHKSVVPYILGGISYTKTSWSRKEWHYYGFPYPWVYDDWVNQGKRPQDYSDAGYRRIFSVDDHTIGTLLGVGMDYFLTKNWALNLDARYHWAKVNFAYTLAFDEGRTIGSVSTGTFVLDSWIVGFGIKYFF